MIGTSSPGHEWRIFLHRNRVFMLICLIPLFSFLCSKKKLVQQRSLQTSDRPIIPNILMMPITKTAEKNDQYAIEWVDSNKSFRKARDIQLKIHRTQVSAISVFNANFLSPTWRLIWRHFRKIRERVVRIATEWRLLLSSVCIRFQSPRDYSFDCERESSPFPRTRVLKFIGEWSENFSKGNEGNKFRIGFQSWKLWDQWESWRASATNRSHASNSNRDQLSFVRTKRLFQVVASLLASLSLLASGMGLGYPAITTQLLRSGSDVVFTPSQISWFASITAIVCPFGGPLSGFLSDKIGRIRTLMLTNIIAIVSWAIIGFSSQQDAGVSFVQLMAGRAIIGLNIGMTTAPTVMFVSEICHPSLRGRLTILSSPFFTAIGLLTIYFLGYLIPVSLSLFENPWNTSNLFRIQTDYRLVSLIAGAITLVSLLLLFLLPESPVYLVTKNEIDKARYALTVFRNLREWFSQLLTTSFMN